MGDAASNQTSDAAGWNAELHLGFAQNNGRTVLSHRRHQGPLQVQRPFYPEPGGVCHVYLLHPPGGMVGGDRLSVDVGVGEGAHALLTTPAAGKFYRNDGVPARLEQRFRVAAGAALEWLPQETIAFDGAHGTLATRVDLAPDGRFMGWEILCLGRLAAGEKYTRGTLAQRFELWREGQPLWLERACHEGGGPALMAGWGLRGRCVTGSFVCVTEPPGLAGRIRAALSALTGEALFSVTQLDGALVCRYLGDSAEQARHCFTRAWALLRPAVLQRDACAPRIWRT